MRNSFVLIFSLLFFGCATRQGILLPETPLSLTESRKAIIGVIGQPRAISENGRELFSNYYDDKGLDFNPARSKQRLSTHVLILGDRRPYDVRVIVEVEEKSGGQFNLVGYDNGRAESLAKQINRSLHESRDKRNVIDDFKPY